MFTQVSQAPRRKRLDHYHHGDLKQALIAEALKVIDEQGSAAVTTRALARRLGVSHAAPGHHFADREALLAEAASEGFRLFADTLAQAASAESAPAERLVAIGRAYLRFAADHPSYLRVMFGRDFPKGAHPPEHLRCEADRAYAVLTGVVRDLTLSLGCDLTLIDELAFGAWSLVHGMAMLWIDGSATHAFAGRAEFEASGERVIRRSILGFAPRGNAVTPPASLAPPKSPERKRD
jgi:AcrR family transcriptional regulator